MSSVFYNYIVKGVLMKSMKTISLSVAFLMSAMSSSIFSMDKATYTVYGVTLLLGIKAYETISSYRVTRADKDAPRTFKQMQKDVAALKKLSLTKEELTKFRNVTIETSSNSQASSSTEKKK